MPQLLSEWTIQHVDCQDKMPSTSLEILMQTTQVLVLWVELSLEDSGIGVPTRLVSELPIIYIRLITSIIKLCQYTFPIYCSQVKFWEPFCSCIFFFLVSLSFLGVFHRVNCYEHIICEYKLHSRSIVFVLNTKLFVHSIQTTFTWFQYNN